MPQRGLRGEKSFKNRMTQGFMAWVYDSLKYCILTSHVDNLDSARFYERKANPIENSIKKFFKSSSTINNKVGCFLKISIFI